jgi:hypothetical protein
MDTTQIEGPLTAAALEDFHRRGYTKVRAFSPDEAAEMENLVWQTLKIRGDVDRDDPSTWSKPKSVSQALRSMRVFRDAISQEFLSTVDQLLGVNKWKRPKDWGRILYSYPSDSPWYVTWRQWHWHGNPARNIDTLEQLTCFFFINHVEPHGGGTMLCEGSHRVVEKYFSELSPDQIAAKLKSVRTRFYRYDPWIQSLTARGDTRPDRIRMMEEGTHVHGYPCRLIELAGEPGEAYITSGSLLHATGHNASDQPRFMRTVDIRVPHDEDSEEDYDE